MTEFKAYVFPGIKVNDKTQTLILKSTFGARIAANDSSLGYGYLLEGDRQTIHSGNIIDRIFGRRNYQDRNAFIEDVKTNFSNCGDNLPENQLEKFAEKNKLTPTKLIFI